MRITRSLAALLFASSLALTACGGGSGSDSGGTDPGSPTTAAPSSDDGGGGGTEVEIADFAFDPGEIEVKVGDTITFTNDDDATHTVTSKDGAPGDFDTGDIGGGKSAEVTVDEAGDYEYLCSIHEYMKGTIRVVE